MQHSDESIKFRESNAFSYTLWADVGSSLIKPNNFMYVPPDCECAFTFTFNFIPLRSRCDVFSLTVAPF